MDGSRAAMVDSPKAVTLPASLSLPRFGDIELQQVDPGSFDRYLHELKDPGELGIVFAGGSAVPETVRKLRARPEFARTRVYVVSAQAGGPVPGWTEDYDVDDILAPSALDRHGLADTVENGLRAYRSLVGDPLYTEYYLDMTYNKIFDWFETTRWNWQEVNLEQIKPELLRTDEVDLLTHVAITEFGTLPGAHNFLREWEGETSFSSWALMWGAEEARHSLVQARYLDQLGVKVRSKHALYKRAPYPMGETRVGTLVMNIISESRASEYYRRLAAQTQEPVIKRIWRLLTRDEARHARAFYVFAQELCQADEPNQIAALKMAYVWLADRSQGVKHPAGHFFPHSTSAKGMRLIDQAQEGATDTADAKVFAMLRRLSDDDSLETPRDIKRKLRAAIQQS